MSTKKSITKKPVTKKPTTKKTTTKKSTTKKTTTKKEVTKKTTTKKSTTKKTTTKKPTTKKTTTKKPTTTKKTTTTNKPTTTMKPTKKSTTKKTTTKKPTTKKPVKKTKLGGDGIISDFSRFTNKTSKTTSLSSVEGLLNTTDKKVLCTNLKKIQELSMNDQLKLSDINKIHEHCRNKIIQNFGNPPSMVDCPDIVMLYVFFHRHNTYQEKQKELGFLSKFNKSRGPNKFKAKTDWGPSATEIGIGQATSKIASFIPI